MQSNGEGSGDAASDAVGLQNLMRIAATKEGFSFKVAHSCVSHDVMSP
jgi:hypothetical protein